MRQVVVQRIKNLDSTLQKDFKTLPLQLEHVTSAIILVCLRRLLHGVYKNLHMWDFSKLRVREHSIHNRLFLKVKKGPLETKSIR